MFPSRHQHLSVFSAPLRHPAMCLFMAVWGLLPVSVIGQLFQTSGTAVSLGNGCFRLTEAQNFESGAAWSTEPIDLNCSFDYTYRVNLGNIDQNGADGIAFVLQDQGPDIAGNAGAGIGYGAITPSLAVELDTYFNPGADPMPCDHISIHEDGRANQPMIPAAQILPNNCNIEDGQFHTFRVSWDATTLTLRAYVDGNLRLTYNRDLINEVFGGTAQVWWGYTAATGGSINEQTFCPIDLGLTGPSTLCTGESITMEFMGNAPPGSTYDWDFDGGTATPGTGPGPHTITWDSPGLKTVRLTLRQGTCENPVPGREIDVRPAPALDTEPDINRVCTGNPTAFSYAADPALVDQLNWTFRGGTPQTAMGSGPHTVVWNTPGSYTLTLAAEANGCTADSSWDLEVIPQPEARFQHPDEVCTGNPVLLTFTGTAPADAIFSWACNGCIPQPTATPGPHSTAWNTPGIKSLTLQIEAPGCADTAAQTIQVRATPEARFSATPQSLCTGDTLTMEARPALPAPLDFTWDCDGCQTGPLNGPGPFTATWDSAGLKRIQLRVVAPYANLSCSDSSRMDIEVKPRPTATFSVAPGTACQQDDITLRYTAPLTAGTQFRWTCDDCKPPNFDTQGPHTIQCEIPGTKTLELLVDLNGCLDSASANLEIVPRPTVQLSVQPAEICLDESTRISYLGTPGPGAIFTWDCGGCSAGSIPPTAGPHTLSWTTPGQKQIRLEVSNPWCRADTGLTVRVKPIPSARISARPPELCLNESTELRCQIPSGGPVDYTWSCNGCQPPPDNRPGPFRVYWSAAGVKTIRFALALEGCASPPALEEVTVHPWPEVNFKASDAVLCAEDTLSIEAGFTPDAQTTLTWSCNGCNSPGPLTGTGPHRIQWPQAGPKTITLTANRLGCIRRQDEEIQVLEAAPINLILEEPPCSPATGLIADPAFASWAWFSLPDTLPLLRQTYRLDTVFETRGPHRLLLRVQDTQGCRRDTLLTYSYDPSKRFNLDIPNVFTPNGDGVNDLFRLAGPGRACVRKLRIYDRWGQLHVTARDGFMQWDGTDRRGNPLPAGTYFYDLVLGKPGETQRQAGAVTLLR